MSESPDPLEQHREEIRALDAEILRLVARRAGVAREIGQRKRDARIPLRDFEVESRVVDRLRRRAVELGLPGDLGEDLALFLIDKAVELQGPIVDSVYDGDRRRVLVVGGLGGMGKWISHFLNVQGHTVHVLDPAEGDSIFPRAASLEAGLAWAELTLLAVPIGACPDVLRRVGVASPPGVVAEMCSVKSHLLPLLADLRARGVRVASFHPMFGPSVRMLSGKRIVICRGGSREDEAVVEDLFASTSARLVEVPLEEHDRAMAAVLGLAHLVNLGFARALERYGIPSAHLDDVAGVTFRRQAATTREVASENPRLYYEIQERNPHTDAALRTLIASLEELRTAVENADEAAFGAIMEAGRRFFAGAEE